MSSPIKSEFDSEDTSPQSKPFSPKKHVTFEFDIDPKLPKSLDPLEADPLFKFCTKPVPPTPNPKPVKTSDACLDSSLLLPRRKMMERFPAEGGPTGGPPTEKEEDWSEFLDKTETTPIQPHLDTCSCEPRVRVRRDADAPEEDEIEEGVFWALWTTLTTPINILSAFYALASILSIFWLNLVLEIPLMGILGAFAIGFGGIYGLKRIWETTEEDWEWGESMGLPRPEVDHVLEPIPEEDNEDGGWGSKGSTKEVFEPKPRMMGTGAGAGSGTEGEDTDFTSGGEGEEESGPEGGQGQGDSKKVKKGKKKPKKGLKRIGSFFAKKPTTKT